MIKEKTKYQDPCSNPSINMVLDAIQLVETQFNRLRKELLYPQLDDPSVYGEYAVPKEDFVNLKVNEREYAKIKIEEIYNKLNDTKKDYIKAACIYRYGNDDKLLEQRTIYARKLRRAIETIAARSSFQNNGLTQ